MIKTLPLEVASVGHRLIGAQRLKRRRTVVRTSARR